MSKTMITELGVSRIYYLNKKMELTKVHINEVIYFIQKYLLVSYYGPGTVLGPGNTSMKQGRKVTCF